jgi:hypothetical protein
MAMPLSCSCALEKNENCQIAEHGLSWKQLFFEKARLAPPTHAHARPRCDAMEAQVVETDLENFDAANMDLEVLKTSIMLAKDHIHQLRVRQFGSQVPPTPLPPPSPPTNKYNNNNTHRHTHTHTHTHTHAPSHLFSQDCD